MVAKARNAVSKILSGKKTHEKLAQKKNKTYLCSAKPQKMVPWPSGEAAVCKTEHSSSILLGTSLRA